MTSNAVPVMVIHRMLPSYSRSGLKRLLMKGLIVSKWYCKFLCESPSIVEVVLKGFLGRTSIVEMVLKGFSGRTGIMEVVLKGFFGRTSIVEVVLEGLFGRTSTMEVVFKGFLGRTSYCRSGPQGFCVEGLLMSKL